MGNRHYFKWPKIYLHTNMIDEGKRYALECWEKFQNKEARGLLDQIANVQGLITLANSQKETDDIVFSCPPGGGVYQFDEVLYETNGMGGSETALIEMARWLKIKTGRRVLVFNTRTEDLTAPSGVEYVSNVKLAEYFSKNKPKVHIAWRHNARVTNAKTYLWCHDLVTPTVEHFQNFEKIMCLTPFHRDYVMGRQGVAMEKIFVTRNGLNPDKFAFKRPKKNPNKLVWLSSPDRGLKRCMLVCDIVKRQFPDIELHVYYGLENLYKYNLAPLAEELKSMMDERPYVKYHGFTEQKKMAREIADAVVWAHTHNFIETFCITALEALELGIYPVTRAQGALINVLDEPSKKGMATLLDFKTATMDHHLITGEELEGYAQAVCEALSGKKWEKMEFNITRHSWESVSSEWVKEMQL
jgi:glycosyltransferase involved in cell wall biosynthesis